MLRKYLILVEGDADLIFFRDYLIFLDSNLEVKTKKIKKELILESQEKKIRLVAIGGYTEIQNKITTIEDSTDQGETVLVIQDADNPQKNHGGVENRLDYLNKIKQKKSSIKFETFLFPNHKDDGDLETLLLQIVEANKFDLANNCYNDFIQCLDKISPSVALELSKDKNKIFNFFRAYYGIDSAKEINRVYDQEYWDFKSEHLNELLKFFAKNIELN